MPLFGGGYPATYSPGGYGYPQYGQAGNGYAQYPQAGQGQQMQQHQQMLTPPTIRAEIVQVDGQDAAERFPLAAGMSQMMMGKDDSFIAIKTQGDGQNYTMVYYDRRPPAPPEPPLDLSAFVRKEEVTAMINEALRGRQEHQKSRQKEVLPDEQHVRQAWTAPAAPAESYANAPAAPAGPGGYADPSRA